MRTFIYRKDISASVRLQDIPGVGPRLGERLISHFGNEDLALKTIIDEDMAELRALMSERQAVSLVRSARGLSYGVSPESFLATADANRIYERILSEISAHANTEYARLRIATLFPTGSIELIEKMRSISTRAVEVRSRLGDLRELLSKIKPLRQRDPPRIKGRAIVVSSSEEFARIKSMGYDKILDLHLAESPGEIRDIAGGYNHVIAITDYEISLPGVEIAERLDIWYIAPEAVLSFYFENRDVLEAALTLAGILEDSGIERFEGLALLRGSLRSLFADDIESNCMEELIRGLPVSIDTALRWANMELRRRIESSSITLGGTELLQALGRENLVRDIFELQLQGLFKSVIAEARAKVVADLQLKENEALWLEDIMPSDVRYPLEIDRGALRAFEHEMKRRHEHAALRKRRELALSLMNLKGFAQNMIKRLMHIDFLYAIGSFALSHKMPVFIENPGIGFRDGRHLFIADPEPVSYSLGDTGIVPYAERVAILSGVNSGGKTSLLELLAQIVILAHMGLPVPASCSKLSIFEELYYFSKSSGTLSAGAFESTMRKLSVVITNKRKIVLADELEAITEPGASARIIASILDVIHESGSVALFVSHLADEIRRFSRSSIRIDGIEAEGLDEDNNLILSRSPRYNHLARSTPELILDRLVRTTDGSEREFYETVLRRFRDSAP